jgi:hypothetical protein
VERSLDGGEFFGIELMQQCCRPERGYLPAFSQKRAGLYLSSPGGKPATFNSATPHPA